MNRQELITRIREKKSCLCVGLDSDVEKIPPHFSRDADGVFAFNREIIDATSDLCVAYKINTAFYESLGATGWEALEKTISYIPDNHFRIADAKRGDIGNTSAQYAKAFFEAMPFDALTVAPYMGEDSVAPFMQYPGKWTIILALTSNIGSNDFQKLMTGNSRLWQEVLRKTSVYGSNENTMYVAGATRPEELRLVREIVPGHFLLVPGVGAQGGKISEVMEFGMNPDVGLLINASRSVIFAGKEKDFAEESRKIALQYRDEMKRYL